MLILKNLEILSQIEWGQMSSKPSGVSLECNTPDSTRRKIVRELTDRVASCTTWSMYRCINLVISPAEPPSVS